MWVFDDKLDWVTTLCYGPVTGEHCVCVVSVLFCHVLWLASSNVTGHCMSAFRSNVNCLHQIIIVEYATRLYDFVRLVNNNCWSIRHRVLRALTDLTVTRLLAVVCGVDDWQLCVCVIDSVFIWALTLESRPTTTRRLQPRTSWVSCSWEYVSCWTRQNRSPRNRTIRGYVRGAIKKFSDWPSSVQNKIKIVFASYSSKARRRSVPSSIRRVGST